MTMKHFSPVSQKWVPCHATKRPCRYGAENHKTTEQLKQMKSAAPSKSRKDHGNNQTPALVINKPEDIKTVFENNLKPGSQDAFNDTYNEWEKGNQAYKKVVGNIKATQEPVVSHFEEQFKKTGGNGKSVLGKITLGDTPPLDTLRQYAADQPHEVKSHVASLSLKVEESEQKFKEAAQRGIST